MMDRFLVPTGSSVDLDTWKPNDTSAFSGGKEAAAERLAQITSNLEELQERLYAEHKHRLLVILQGVDCAGKDGTIRHVFEGVNPQGVRVANFKVPSSVESDHDYLWRIHRQCPARGEIVIFNRSHYEDVLVVRVHSLVSPDVWGRRFDQINDFERMLAEEGVSILKFFLHIDRDEQKKRLQERLDEPKKRWKFSLADTEERKLWDSYRKAYEEALSRTSTDHAPWRIVPANHPWFRNLYVAETIVDTLEGLKMKYPDPPKGWESAKIV
jgi:PPK2 family polyphosphate:nucleotide phosphotransferase